MKNGDRIYWIDCAKGITILLVIIGHSIYNPMVRGPIFSFHMPLFFILSGMTYKWSKDIIEYMHDERAYMETKPGEIIPFSLAKEIKAF